MENSISGKLPMSGTVVYDSGNTTSNGKKRIIIPGGGVSVADRARLFGTQVTTSSPYKNPQLSNQQIQQQQQQPSYNNQSTKSNVIHDDRSYQQIKTNVDRRPKQDTSYSTTQRILNNRQQPVQINTRKKYEQPSSNDSHHYSAATRSRTHNQHSSPNRQPLITHNRYQYDSPPKQRYNNISPTQIILSGESYTIDDKVNNDSYLNSYDKQNTSSHYQQQSYNISNPSTNYFQPIKDPLEDLFKNSSQKYYQQQIPMKDYTNTNSIQAFDLGNLIHRIQQDYMDNARPYVSSIEYIENSQNLANIGLTTPVTSRQDYTRQTNDLYRQKISSNHYDIIGLNNFHSSTKRPSKHPFNDNPYLSMQRRRRYQKRYHDRAVSPIHTVETSDKINKQHKPERSPVAIVPKAPTPTAIISNEKKEEPTTTNKKLETSPESSSLESEDESEINTSKQPSVQSINAMTTGTPATQRNDITRPTLPNKTPSNITARTQAKQDESEESETEETESDSDSDSDSDDDDDEQPQPPSNIRSNNLRTTPSTPQRNAQSNNLRVPPATPQRNAQQNNSRTISTTPQTNARLLQQRPISDTNNTNEPPITPKLGSREVFNIEDPGKSSFGSKLKSIFRRKKS
ncbi:unnamed protein product [Rotaria sordida]|uniref:Uncharacterized protein n=1 Tax=Rotaria sordida TaxID=392033 RepID=A0A814D7V3_9BILA|nr:unnamed protein product [Rotaria sordida]